MRVFAIDWSGARSGASKKIWLAEAAAGKLLQLRCGLSREQVCDYLIEAVAADPQLVAGFDFAFSFPAWFLQQRGLASASDLWQAASEQCETWLSAREPPFWGWPGSKRPRDVELFRREDWRSKAGGSRAKSVFQVGGPGSVGTGSLRGWPILHRLRGAGFSVWPFDAVSLPLVLEIYPRLMTGAVNKSSRVARVQHLARNYPDLAARWRGDMEASDDAFDAGISAIVMSRHVESFATLPLIEDEMLLLEGMIWRPPE